MKRTAECCCGACVVEVDGDPELYGICNCNNCKKRTGSTFGLSAYFESARVQLLQGELHSYRLSGARGAQDRRFCSHCGTTLLWYSEYFQDMVGVAGGCFIEQPLPAPQFIAQYETRCEWLSFAAGIRIGFTAADLPRA